MYNTKYIITYNDSSVFLESDKISEYDKNFIIDALYRNDLLNIFGVEEVDFNENIFDKIINDLYKIVSVEKDFLSLIKTLASKYMSIDYEFGLMLLFSFDYLFLTHPCICEFIDTGKISKEKIEELKKLINN
jgi:hypothetical protein